MSEQDKHPRPKYLDGVTHENIKQEYFWCKEMAYFQEGFIEGAKNFAIWKDGQQLVGCLEQPWREALKYNLDLKDDLNKWIAQIELDNEDYWTWI